MTTLSEAQAALVDLQSSDSYKQHKKNGTLPKTRLGSCERHLNNVITNLSEVVPPLGNFGAKIRLVFPEMVGTPLIVRTWEEYSTVIQKPGTKIIHISGLMNVPVNVPVPTDSYVFGLDRKVDGIKGGRFQVDSSHVRLRELQVVDSPYDGVKIADNAPASMVHIDRMWIHGVDDQGILTGWKPSSYLWYTKNKIEDVGRSQNPQVSADGHCIYLGGPTSKVVIMQNELHPKAFGIQFSPSPTEVLVSQNEIIGGDTRGGMIWYENPSNIMAVGNVIRDSHTSAFEVWAQTDCTANDNIIWNCPNGIWAPGLKQLPGSNNVIGDPALLRKGFIRKEMWDYVLSADAGYV